MWEYQLANAFKDNTKQSKEKSISGASATIGTIERIDPLTISAFGGDAIYDADQILKTRTFADRTLQSGKRVLIVPIGSYSKICIIDLIGE